MARTETEPPGRDLDRRVGAIAIHDLDAAIALVVDTYGAEVFGFLTTTIGERAARDAYAGVVDGVRGDLLRVVGRGHLRPWLYGLARQAARRRPARFTGARRGGEVDAWRRRLSLDERELLVLRIDRRLPWRDIARAYLGLDASDAALDLEAGRLRRQLVALRLRIGSGLARRRGDGR